MESNLYDNRFIFRFDNPFETDNDKRKLASLKEYMSNNFENFCDVDAMKESRYKIIYPEQEIIFVIINDSTDISKNPITNYVKRFIMGVKNISTELQNWSVTQNIVGSSNVISSSDVADTVSNIINTNPAFTTIPNLHGSNSHLTYDCSTDKTIEYDDLKTMCINIALSKKFSNETNEITSALEEERRKQLIAEITELRNVRLIGAVDDIDLTDLTIEQLEACKEHCEKLFETFKFSEVCKSFITVGGVIYDGIFPDGIQVGKYTIGANGIGDEILSTFLDPHTVTGLAFMRVLRKYGLSVSNEAFLLFKGAEKVLTKIEVKKIEEDNEEEIVQTTSPTQIMKIEDDEDEDF
jgi:hypothetical protein